MKYGIFTFHRALNYGAVLQGYALQHFINSSIDECEIVDYKNEALEIIYHSNKIILNTLQQFRQTSVKSMIFRAIELPYIKMLEKRFDLFIQKNIKISKQSYNKMNVSECSEHYNYLITGSDQVWNKTLTNGDNTYYLDFGMDNQIIAFAVSLGAYEPDEKTVELIKRFNKLSLREKQSSFLFQKKYKLNSETFLDPVFLLSDLEWSLLLEKKKPKISDKYILIFTMNAGAELIDIAKHYKNGYRIIFLSTRLRRKLDLKVSQIWLADPVDFLFYIRNAEYIFTDSFHGTAFSILFKKKFYVSQKEILKSDNRIVNLLNQFGLEDASNKEKFVNMKYDMDKYNQAIMKNTAESLKFLKDH